MRRHSFARYDGRLNGGALQLINAGANGQTFAGLTLSSDSIFDLDGSSLTVDALGTLADASLTILDWMAATSPAPEHFELKISE